MQCLKCGRETLDREVFCPDCLAVMAASPVKSDTPVTLPHRDQPEKKPVHRKQPKPDVVISRLHKANRRLWVAVAVLAVLFAISAGMLAHLLYQNYTTPAIGSNYNTISSDGADR